MPFSYVMQDGGKRIEVKDGGGEVCLDCHYGIEGGPADMRADKVVDGDDTLYAMNLAKWAVLEARHVLPHGCFNNMVDLASGKRGYLTPEGGRVSPRHLKDRAERMADFFLGDDFNFVQQLAGRYHAARETGGGVCSLVSHVTMGLVTKEAAPGTTACIVWDQADHSFVVLYHGNSPWIVADPWVHDPWIIPWDDCYFKQPGQCWQIDVKKKAGVPFGVEFPDETLIAAKKAGNVGEDVPRLYKLKEDEDPPASNERTSKARMYHMDHAWFHVTNIGDAAEPKWSGAGWEPIATALQWGDAAPAYEAIVW